MNADALRRGIVHHLRTSVGRPATVLGPEHFYRALALAVRDQLSSEPAATPTADRVGAGSVGHAADPHADRPLSRLLSDHDIEEAAETALQGLGQDLETVLACEATEPSPTGRVADRREVSGI